jgi:hypothetical protein
MSCFNNRLQTLVAPSTLVLLGAICIVGTGALDGVCQDRIQSEAEEVKEISEHDDVDQQFAIVDTQVTLIHGHGFDEWLKTDHESALLSYDWRCWSRGPPTV